MDDSDIVTFRSGEADNDNDSQTSERSDDRDQSNVPNDLISSLWNSIKRVEERMVDFDRKLEGMQGQLDRNQNHQIARPVRNSPCRSVENEINGHENLRRGLNVGSPSTPRLEEPNRIFSNNNQNSTVKVKPQTFNGVDDLDEYLTQFEVVSDLNGWNYEVKSLCLASSLTGEARGILNDLDGRQRRDYHSLVDALNNRYGSFHRAEVYRSQLQSKVKLRDENLTQLAQSIKKLTRKAYPKANNEVIDILALDYYIDAIPETDIRLRLREVGPKNINEAEKIAVRLEAHRIADRQRGRHVRLLDQDNSNKVTLETLEKSITCLTEQVKQISNGKGQNPGAYNNTNSRHASFGRNDRHNNYRDRAYQSMPNRRPVDQFVQTRGDNYARAGNPMRGDNYVRAHNSMTGDNYARAHNSMRGDNYTRADNHMRGDNSDKFQGNLTKSRLGATGRLHQRGPSN